MIPRFRVAVQLRGLRYARRCKLVGQEVLTSQVRSRLSCSPISALTASFTRFLSTDSNNSDSSDNGLDSLRTLANWIQESAAGDQPNILVLCGAGVSVAAGIPDFRTPGTGLYDNLQRYNLPYPEAIFDLDYFRARPQAFLTLAKEIWPGGHSPTLTHSFLALLEQKNLLLRCYTQNIDGLEFLGGVTADRIVECHGHFRRASCTRCGAEAGIDMVKDCIMKEVPQPPLCNQCHSGFIKPDIVFFGEALPDRMNSLLQRDLREATLLLIMGTSLQVAPVSQIPEWVQPNCRRALLNRDFVGNLDPNEPSRDLFYSGDCDESVEAICSALGWNEELRRQHGSTRAGSNQ